MSKGTARWQTTTASCRLPLSLFFLWPFFFSFLLLLKWIAQSYGGVWKKEGKRASKVRKTRVINSRRREYKEFARLFTVYGTILSSSHLLLLRARNKPRLSPQTGSFQEENQDNRVIVVAAGAGTSHLRRRLRDSRALKNTQMEEYLAHTVPGCCSVQSSARSRSRFNRPRK